jgi:hypothetical protein
VRLEGIAQSVDSGGACDPEQRPQHGAENVRVFMRIDVSEANSALLQSSNLRGDFGFDFGGSDAAPEKAV